MKITWKVRLKNKVWLAAMASLIITFVYAVLEMLDVVPSLSENRVIEIVQCTLTVLGMIGVIADPTTAGLEDSNRAMGYDQPWNDEADAPDTEEG